LDEAVEHNTDGEVDIVLTDVLTEMHLGGGLRHTQDGFDVSHGDGDSTRGVRKGGVGGS